MLKISASLSIWREFNPWQSYRRNVKNATMLQKNNFIQKKDLRSLREFAGLLVSVSMILFCAHARKVWLILQEVAAKFRLALGNGL